MKKLIILTGHPGSGKTSIARQLSRLYSIPYVSKDAIKEHIFDALGSQDKQWSLRTSGAAHRIIDDVITTNLATGNSIIVESNFKPEIDSRRFAKITEEYSADCLQILCTASVEVLYERWIRRIENRQRHEGHVEAIGLDEIRENFEEEYEALELPGELVQIDTTDFSLVDKALRQLSL